MKTTSPIYRYLAIVLFFTFALNVCWNLWNVWSHCDTVGRQVQATFQIIYGILSLLAGVLLTMKRSLPKVLEWTWSVALSVAAGMAPVVWSTGSELQGVAAAVGGVLVALGILWLERRGFRGLTSRSS